MKINHISALASGRFGSRKLRIESHPPADPSFYTGFALFEQCETPASHSFARGCPVERDRGAPRAGQRCL